MKPKHGNWKQRKTNSLKHLISERNMTATRTKVTTEEKLEVAVRALERIAENDPGPARHIAAAALAEIGDLLEESQP
jgi:hypothetical protein